jgi:phage gp16-like protein
MATQDPAARARRERQIIGIARRQLGIPDDSHAERVHRLTGGRTRSTRECDAAERRAILAEYKAAGFRVTKPKRAGRTPKPQTLDRKTMLTRVEQLLTTLGLPWAYAESILRRQRGIDRGPGVVAPLETATDPELRGVIAALDRRRRKLATTEESA